MTPLVYTPPADPWLVVLHADRDLVVVDKPAGLLSVPGREPALADSAYTRVRAAHPLAQVVHRLDLATSGVLVFATRRKAEAHLRAQFRARRVEKVYVAIVAGAPTDDVGEIDLPLGPDPARPPLQRVDARAGRPALTRWRVLAREGGHTRLELRPVTGRSHQLRLHLSAVGLPILGDAWYAPPETAAAAPRLCLHAASLALDHPWTGERRTYAAAVPF